VLRLAREVFKAHRGGNLPPVLVLPQQKAQKGGLPPAVAPGEAQLPFGVDLEAHVLEDVIVTAVIGKGQMRYLNQRHCYALQKQKSAAGKSLQPSTKKGIVMSNMQLKEACFPQTDITNQTAAPPPMPLGFVMSHQQENRFILSTPIF
jgi:hypothetical protein